MVADPSVEQGEEVIQENSKLLRAMNEMEGRLLLNMRTFLEPIQLQMEETNKTVQDTKKKRKIL